LFVNNLTNSHDALARAHDTPTSPLYYAQSYQPRTIGVSVQVTY
jgi:iron complex outermembrane receptor protein